MTINFVPGTLRLPESAAQARREADAERSNQSLADVTEEIRKERVRRQYRIENLFPKRRNRRQAA